MKRYYNYSLRG